MTYKLTLGVDRLAQESWGKLDWKPMLVLPLLAFRMPGSHQSYFSHSPLASSITLWTTSPDMIRYSTRERATDQVRKQLFCFKPSQILCIGTHISVRIMSSLSLNVPFQLWLLGYRVSNKGPKIQESTLAPITHDMHSYCLCYQACNAAETRLTCFTKWQSIDVPKSQAYNVQGMIEYSELSTVLIRAHQSWKPSNLKNNLLRDLLVQCNGRKFCTPLRRKSSVAYNSISHL